MTHAFTVQHTLENTNLADVRLHMADPEFHIAVCKKVPSENLKILASTQQGQHYTLKREHNLDVHIPDIAKRFLKDAFKLWRDDIWDTAGLTCQSTFRMNMPAAFRCQTRISESANTILVRLDWEVDISIPLIHGILARHAESEIRRFNAIEIGVIHAEVQLRRERSSALPIL